MKRLFLSFAVLLGPLLLKAQDFPLGKSQEEIRRFRATPPHSALNIFQSDTCDRYKLGDLTQENYYYQNSVCYKSKQTYSLMPNEEMSQSIELMQQILNDKFKKVKENDWTNADGSEKIELSILKDKNQYVVEIISVPR